MNNIDSVASILGVKLNEWFKIQFCKHKRAYDMWYEITEQGLLFSYDKKHISGKSDALQGLILGKHKIIIE